MMLQQDYDENALYVLRNIRGVVFQEQMTLTIMAPWQFEPATLCFRAEIRRKKHVTCEWPHMKTEVRVEGEVTGKSCIDVGGEARCQA